MMPSEAVRVAIVEDDRATREGLAMMIGGTPGFECNGHYRSVEDALAAKTPAPDVVLLDIHLPGMLGSDGIGLIQEKHPSAKIVMLTVFDESERIFESICNGACGYLLKKTPPARLLEAILDAHNGGAPMSSEVARRVVKLFREFAPPRKVDYGLTDREQKVLELLAEGYSYTALAAQLEITANTVRNHIRSIYEKLHVHSRSEAVSKALRRRLI
jgi:DNA-binding NarL/FixJ family response regulator